MTNRIFGVPRPTVTECRAVTITAIMYRQCRREIVRAYPDLPGDDITRAATKWKGLFHKSAIAFIDARDNLQDSIERCDISPADND